MKSVFADAAYWIALTRVNDQWNAAARQAREQLGEVVLVTTEEVLMEFLAALSNGGPYFRNGAVQAIRMIQTAGDVQVVHQSHESFENGLARYANRSDKSYSLQDCISMNVMESEGITEILTGDHHFEQEGFTILMRRP